MEFSNVPMDGRKKLTASTVSMVSTGSAVSWPPSNGTLLQDDDSDEFEPIQVPDEDDNALQGTHSAFKQPYRSAWRPDVSI